MTPEQQSKQDFWQQHIEDWHQSKLTQKEYCKHNDISFANFGYWRTRLNKLAQPDKKFIPVTVGQPHSQISVFLPGGLRLDVPSHSLADVLPIVYDAIQ
jgi:hypothetical protein